MGADVGLFFIPITKRTCGPPQRILSGDSMALNCGRICLVNNLYPPVPSGSSHFTHELSRRLAKRGHEVTVITARVQANQPELEVTEGVTIHRLPCVLMPRLRIAHNFKWMSYTFTRDNVRRFMKIIRERDVDVMHLNGHFFDLGLSAVLARRALGIPLVLTIHAWIRHPHPLYGAILRFADRHFVRRAIIRNCDELVVPDKEYQERSAHIYHRDDAHVVPYGLQYPVMAKELDQSWIERFRLDSSRVIVSLGHVHEMRDRCDLIEAMPLVLKEQPNTMLLIIGEVYYDRPVKLVEKLGLGRNVIFTGSLRRDVALSLVQRADIEAHWGRQAPPALGIACLEAMGLGKAIMTHTRSDLLGSATIENWKHLVLAPRNDKDAIAEALLKLLRDDALRRAIGENAREFVRKNYAWDAVCSRMESIYSSAIQARRMNDGPVNGSVETL